MVVRVGAGIEAVPYSSNKALDPLSVGECVCELGLRIMQTVHTLTEQEMRGGI
jgi:hypothetical protein